MRISSLFSGFFSTLKNCPRRSHRRNNNSRSETPKLRPRALHGTAFSPDQRRSRRSREYRAGFTAFGTRNRQPLDRQATRRGREKCARATEERRPASETRGRSGGRRRAALSRIWILGQDFWDRQLLIAALEGVENGGRRISGRSSRRRLQGPRAQWRRPGEPRAGRHGRAAGHRARKFRQSVPVQSKHAQAGVRRFQHTRETRNVDMRFDLTEMEHMQSRDDMVEGASGGGISGISSSSAAQSSSSEVGPSKSLPDFLSDGPIRQRDREPASSQLMRSKNRDPRCSGAASTSAQQTQSERLASQLRNAAFNAEVSLRRTYRHATADRLVRGAALLCGTQSRPGGPIVEKGGPDRGQPISDAIGPAGPASYGSSFRIQLSNVSGQPSRRLAG
ncbi:unnamed protein product [Nesidiocoris tenuis]|uniref:Uncharacterized protein n=1 Tax=Nesidiocoris tenuis TaxID=355587 RepID=A0A6H5H7D6_9HEMI|nr:unnamed protein product [Nesidiocoris tenuis]